MAVPGDKMTVDFRGHPMFPSTGFNTPTRFEADVYDCEVWGKVPTDIEGNFYRMQCDFQYRPPQNEWPTGFNGDGHLSRFNFSNGNVNYRGRYVKTARLLAERAAHKRLYGVYRNHYTDDPSVQKLDRSAANTHMYWHGGKLLVLKEDALPWVVDPHTLETQGVWDFHGKYTATSMSAHPKIDPATGEMIAYGYQAKGDLTDDVAVYTVGKDGRISNEVWFKVPYVGIMHDIAITQNYVLLPVVARTTSEARLRSGEPMWEWDGSKPTMVGSAAAQRQRQGRALVQGAGAQHAALPQRRRAQGRQDHDGPAHFQRRARPLAVPALDLRHEVEEGRHLRRGSDLHGQWRARAHGRPLPVAAVPLLLRRQPRSLAAIRQGARRRHGRLRHQPVPAGRRDQSGGRARQVLRRTGAGPAGKLLRAAQGQHRRGRWLPPGHRQQLRDDVLAISSSSMRSAWKRAPSPP